MIAIPATHLVPGDIMMVPDWTSNPNGVLNDPALAPVASMSMLRAGSTIVLGSTSGTVTLTAVLSNHIQGTLSTVMDDGQGHSGTVTGQFDAPACAALW
jgi:hypothetical protein